MMTRLQIASARWPVVLATLFVLPLQGAASLDDLKANRALSQNPPDWGQALTYLLQAHKDDRTKVERYRLIAGCLQNSSRPLAAMAWYQAYRMAPGADPQQVKNAGVQVELLEVDVRSKMGYLFTEAVNVAEKQIKDKVGFQGGKYKTADSLFALPRLQADAGMPAEAAITERRIKALGVQPANHSVFMNSSDRPFYRTGPQLVTLADRHVFAAALAGDAATVQTELAKTPGALTKADEETKARRGYTRQEGWVYLAELIRFNLNQEDNHRVAVAEQITQKDPMEDLDARTGQVLRQADVAAIPLALAALAEDVGRTLLRVRAMRPENAKTELAAVTRHYALKQVRQICSSGLMFSEGPDYARVAVRAVSRFEDAGVMRDVDGRDWPLIAWALKQSKESSGVAHDTIALLTECGMGVNDPVVTPVEDAAGNTALHWAVQTNNLAAVDVLLAHRANPALKNKRGLTPLDIAQTPYRLVGDQIRIGEAITQRLQTAMKAGN
jgi:hypothetical protein